MVVGVEVGAVGAVEVAVGRLVDYRWRALERKHEVGVATNVTESLFEKDL